MTDVAVIKGKVRLASERSEAAQETETGAKYYNPLPASEAIKAQLFFLTSLLPMAAPFVRVRLGGGRGWARLQELKWVGGWKLRREGKPGGGRREYGGRGLGGGGVARGGGGGYRGGGLGGRGRKWERACHNWLFRKVVRHGTLGLPPRPCATCPWQWCLDGRR